MMRQFCTSWIVYPLWIHLYFWLSLFNLGDNVLTWVNLFQPRSVCKPKSDFLHPPETKLLIFGSSQIESITSTPQNFVAVASCFLHNITYLGPHAV